MLGDTTLLWKVKPNSVRGEKLSLDSAISGEVGKLLALGIKTMNVLVFLILHGCK